MSKKSWRLEEALAGKCSFEVVGMDNKDAPLDTYSSKWVKGDVEAGRCLFSEMGTIRYTNVSVPQSPTPIEEDKPLELPTTINIEELLEQQPMSVEERRRVIQIIHDGALRSVATNVGGAIENSASVVNNILTQSSRLLEKQDDTLTPWDQSWWKKNEETLTDQDIARGMFYCMEQFIQPDQQEEFRAMFSLSKEEAGKLIKEQRERHNAV